jgi:hypothetical protein
MSNIFINNLENLHMCCVRLCFNIQFELNKTGMNHLKIQVNNFVDKTCQFFLRIFNANIGQE